MAMRVLESDTVVSSHRSVDIFSLPHIDALMDVFMGVFDIARTVGEDETWEVWAKQNDVIIKRMMSEADLMICFIGHSPYIKNIFNKAEAVEATYHVSCHLHEGEEEYLSFIKFLLSET